MKTQLNLNLERFTVLLTALLTVSLTSLLAYQPVSAQTRKETVVTLQSITVDQLKDYKEPALFDADLLQERIRQLKSGLKALTHMSEMISEEHARRALNAQVKALEATLHELEFEAESAARIDYRVPEPVSPPRTAPPSPRIPQDNSPAHQASPTTLPTLVTPSVTSSSPERPIDAAQFSRYWSAIEAATFSEGQMRVIRNLARDDYLSVEQASILITVLSFSRDRRDAVIMLYPRLVDPHEVNQLLQLVDQQSHRREVKRRLKQLDLERRQRQTQY